jgi:hypothetical protein
MNSIAAEVGLLASFVALGTVVLSVLLHSAV